MKSFLSHLKLFFQDGTPAPGQVDDRGRITDRAIQNRNRLKFGIGNIMYQSEECGLGPIHTAIIKALGGGAVQLGYMGAAGSVGSLVQWLGAWLLARTGSSRRAMTFALLGGAAAGFALTALLLMALEPGWRPWCLTGYVIFGLLLAGASGIQVNIETSWIGDLTPPSMMGWFTSIKWLISALGGLAFLLLFGAAAQWGARHPQYELHVYAALLLLVGCSHIVAVLLIRTISDRRPQPANLLFAGKGNARLHYAALPFWGYIAFFVLWSGGRSSLIGFTTAYLLSLNYSMTGISMLLAIQFVISGLMLLVLGRVTDRFGSRRPLIAVSGVIACCMFLWVASAWFGLAPIILYMIVNGAAGHAHRCWRSTTDRRFFHPAAGPAISG